MYDIYDLYNVSLVVIHYSEYFSNRLKLIADYYQVNNNQLGDYTEINFEHQQYINEATIDIIVPALPKHGVATIKSYLLNLRKVQYINISLYNEGPLLDVAFHSIRKNLLYKDYNFLFNNV